jgi:hypothetical protein
LLVSKSVVATYYYFFNPFTEDVSIYMEALLCNDTTRKQDHETIENLLLLLEEKILCDVKKC